MSPLLVSVLINSAVDSLLDPENRLHLTTEEQLKALLDKLDVVTSMRTSGGRTKRIRLLRREINALRQKMNQQQQQSAHPVNGNEKEEDGKEEEKEEGEEEAGDAKEKKTEKTNNGVMTAVSNSGAGIFSLFHDICDKMRPVMVLFMHYYNYSWLYHLIHRLINRLTVLTLENLHPVHSWSS